MHDGLLAELVGGPGHAAAVVAVRGGEKRRLAEVTRELVAREVVVGHLGDRAADLARDVVGHGEGAAEHLERVEAKAVGLVLDGEVREAQLPRQRVELGEGRDVVLREAPVEAARRLHVLERHDAQVRIVALGHLVDDPLDLLAHASSLLLCVPFGATCQLFV